METSSMLNLSRRFAQRAYTSCASAPTHSAQAFTDVVVTPATLLTELVTLFPPVVLSNKDTNGRTPQPTRLVCYDWQRLFLVRHQDHQGQPTWPACTPAGGTTFGATNGGLLSSRSGLWHPRGSLCAQTAWHHAVHGAAKWESNCDLSGGTATASESDAVLRVWEQTLTYMRTKTARPTTEDTKPLHGWSTSAVYAIYHAAPQLDVRDSRRRLLNTPQHIGTYYAIPGLPQPPPNVTTMTGVTGRRKGDGRGGVVERSTAAAVQGTVLTLCAYLSFVVPSYQPGMERGLAEYDAVARPPSPSSTMLGMSRMSAGTDRAAQTFLFDAPRHFVHSSTTRGRVANRQVYWQCVPLNAYLRQWPTASLAPHGDATRSGVNTPGSSPAHEADDVPHALTSHLSQQTVAVIVLLEACVWHFSLIMHVHNPFLATQADLNASEAAAACFAFVQSPVQEDQPTGLEKYLQQRCARPATDAERDANNSAAEPHSPTASQTWLTPRTVLVHDEEDKTYRLPYYYAAPDTAKKKKGTRRMHSTVRPPPADQTRASSYRVRWHAEEDQRQRAREALLCVFLSRPPPSQTGVAASPVLFAPFPPSSKLLRSKPVFHKPHALAEEMRYGRLVRHA